MNIKIQIIFLLFCEAFNLYNQSPIDFHLNLNKGQCFKVVKDLRTEGTSTMHGKTSDVNNYFITETEYNIIRKVKNGFELSIRNGLLLI